MFYQVECLDMTEIRSNQYEEKRKIVKALISLVKTHVFHR